MKRINKPQEKLSFIRPLITDYATCIVGPSVPLLTTVKNLVDKALDATGVQRDLHRKLLSALLLGEVLNADVVQVVIGDESNRFVTYGVLLNDPQGEELPFVGNEFIRAQTAVVTADVANAMRNKTDGALASLAHEYRALVNAIHADIAEYFR